MNQVEQAQQVRQALDDLTAGCESPDDVARKLKQAECYGETQMGDRCPVAHWMWKRIPDLGVTIDMSSAEWFDPDPDPEDGAPIGPVSCLLPDPVAAFVSAFDDGCYPELAAAAGLDPLTGALLGEEAHAASQQDTETSPPPTS